MISIDCDIFAAYNKAKEPLWEATPMKRLIMDDLMAWKNSKRRKPLVLRGARQVGKT